MNRFRLLAVTAALGLLVAGCGSGGGSAESAGSSTSGGGGTSSGGGLQTVNVGQVQLSIFAPMYVADAKGYFKDAGIKLDLQAVKSGQDAIPLAASGKLDAVVAGFSAGMLSAISSGLEVQVVGSMGVAGDTPKSNPTALVGQTSLNGVADLKGKKVAVAGGAGGTGAYLLGLAMEDAGLSINDVNLVNLGNPDMPTALKNGSIDAGMMSAPFSDNAINDGSGKSLWTPPAGYSGTGVIYGGQFAKSDLAQPFFDALVRGAQDLQGEARFSDENVKIIADATDQTPEKVKSLPLYTWKPDLAPLPGQLKKAEQIWMEDGALDYTKPLPQKDYINASFSKNAK